MIAQHSTATVIDDLRGHAREIVAAVGAAFAAFYLGAVLIFSFEENRRRRLEQRIGAAQRSEHLGLMAAGTAHDFNNMLTAISGNAALVRIETPDDSAVQAYVDDIDFAVARASELTRQLQHYAGGGAQRIELVSLNILLEDSVRVLRPTIGDSVTVEVRTDGQLPDVLADDAQARQAFLNLTRNALDSLQSRAAGDGELKLSTRILEFSGEILGAHVVCSDDARPGMYASVRFSDNGGGIPKDALSRVFDPYFTSKGTGRGLGLAAVAGIVRKHSGAIAVRSREGRGTTFEVFFPLPASSGDQSVTG